LRTNNTIHNLLRHKNQTTDTYILSGVYKITCPECKKEYVGQTGRGFEIRFNEHKNAFRNNSHTSKFAKHLIEQAHTFDTIHNTMKMLQYQSTSTLLNVSISTQNTLTITT
jgi:hypothetical protein